MDFIKPGGSLIIEIGESVESHVALLHVQPRDVPAALPQTLQRGNDVFHDQGEVWRGGPGENARGASERGVMQSAVSQSLRAHSIHL